ncbi:MAG: hypothetical protein ACR2NG_02975 [Acidimicrobiia bacterium]
MAKHKHDDRIRVIAVGDDRSVEPQSQGESESTPEPRRWGGRTALVALIGALAVAIAIFAAFGGIGEQEPEAEPLSIDRFTPAPATESSSEFHLLVSAASDGQQWSVVWDSSDDPMALGAIGAIPNRSREFAHFTTVDAGGNLQASQQCSGGECRIRLVRVDDPSLLLGHIDAPTYTWHSSMPNGIAWLDRNDGFVTTARIDPDLGRLIEQRKVAATEGAVSMVRWDDEGFVLSGERTIVVTGDGSDVWGFDGWTLDASLSTVTVTDGTRWLVLDRRTGSEIVVASPGEGLLEIVGGAPDDWQSEATDVGYTYSIAVGSARTRDIGELSASRTVPTDGARGAEYRVFRSTSEDAVIIVYEGPDVEPIG